MGNTLQARTTLLPQKISPPQQDQPPQEPEEQQQDDENQQVFTCEICIEPTPILEKRFRNANNCCHPFCTDCIVKYISATLEEHNQGRISCPSPTCHHALDPVACASLVGPKLFARWGDALCESAIAGYDRCYCPYGDCNTLIVNECGGGGSLRKSKCPKCMRWFCFGCRTVWHAGFGCEESGELREGNDVAFGRLVERNKWMRCPRCRHFVELREGCQIVKCRCGISFCYRCGKQVHKHWCRCDSPSTCCVWCMKICVALAFFVLAFSLMKLTSHMHIRITK